MRANDSRLRPNARATRELERARRHARAALHAAEQLARGHRAPETRDGARVRARLDHYRACGVPDHEAHARNLRALRADVAELERAIATFAGLTSRSPMPRQPIAVARRPRSRRAGRRRRSADRTRGSQTGDPDPTPAPKPRAQGDEEASMVAMGSVLESSSADGAVRASIAPGANSPRNTRDLMTTAIVAEVHDAS